MANNQELISIAQQFTGLPMDALIGGPLNAAAEANAAMAMTQTQFMLDTCFKVTTEDDKTTYDPIIVEMTLKRSLISPGIPTEGDPNPEQHVVEVPTTFQLPLLTIIPLNSLAVDSVDISFEMEVSSSFSETQTQESKQKIAAEASFETKIGWGPISATIKGSASYDKEDASSYESHYEKKNSAKYSVNVHAVQQKLPEGVSTIIKAYAGAIEPLQLAEASEPPALADDSRNNQLAAEVPKPKQKSRAKRN